MTSRHSSEISIGIIVKIIVRNQDLILSYQEIDCEKMFLKVLAPVFSSNFFEIFTQKINVSSIATLAVPSLH